MKRSSPNPPCQHLLRKETGISKKTNDFARTDKKVGTLPTCSRRIFSPANFNQSRCRILVFASREQSRQVENRLYIHVRMRISIIRDPNWKTPKSGWIGSWTFANWISDFLQIGSRTFATQIETFTTGMSDLYS